MHHSLAPGSTPTCSDAAIDLFTPLSCNECTGEAAAAARRIKGGHTRLRTNVLRCFLQSVPLNAAAHAADGDVMR